MWFRVLEANLFLCSERPSNRPHNRPHLWLRRFLAVLGVARFSCAMPETFSIFQVVAFCNHSFMEHAYARSLMGVQEKSFTASMLGFATHFTQKTCQGNDFFCADF